MHAIETYVRQYFGLTDHAVKDVVELFVEERVNKHDFLLRTGKYSTSLSFVKEGYFRMSALDSSGEKEVTQWIGGKGYFLTDISSFYFEKPGRWNIQALSDCVIYKISLEDYKQIGRFSPEWNHLEKLFLAKCFMAIEQRVFQLLSMSAEERYKELFKEDSEIFNHVPLQHLASMMGMSPETLSRIRRKSIS